MLSGPWGELEPVPLLLEPNGDLLAGRSDFKSWREGTVWRIPAHTAAEVKDLLREAGLSADQVRQLTADDVLTRNHQLNCHEIRPPDEVILSLTPAQRRALYPRFRAGDPSSPFLLPYQLPRRGIDGLMGRPTKVPGAQLDRLRKLTFQVGQMSHFSDISFVLGEAANDEERIGIMKLLARQPAYALYLKVPGTMSFSSLAKYWGANGRNKEVLPILESVAGNPEADTIDIVHLLPPFPRKVLNTYPTTEGEHIGQDFPDCFWTALSFFSESPPDRHLDFISHVVRERYEPAVLPPQLGDLIVISDKTRETNLHACNHIAGDFVFTKNGQSGGRPWVISSLDEVIASYLETDLSLTFLRLKPEYRK